MALDDRLDAAAAALNPESDEDKIRSGYDRLQATYQRVAESPALRDRLDAVIEDLEQEEVGPEAAAPASIPVENTDPGERAAEPIAGPDFGTILVCLRTPLAALTVASTAARLGMTGVVRTAVSETEAMIRLTERPAEVVLADTAVTRPDSAGFTRRVLARAPRAKVILFGAEDPRVAAAAVAAGARGVIRGVENDLVSAVSKALMLLLPTRPQGMPINTGHAQPTSVAGFARSRYPDDVDDPQAMPARPEGSTRPGEPPIDPFIGRPMAARPGTETLVGVADPAPAGRRLTLTERELQVLRGMADGKSNAEIGRALFVSEDTVGTHARRLFRKLGALNTAHAVAAGFRAGLIA